MKSIRFLDNELKMRLSAIPVLKEYIESSENAIEGKEPIDKDNNFFNASRLTNLGVFRYYTEAFVRRHPLIDKNQPFVVRHRPPEGNGLPLQVYGFSLNNQMVPYENIQSEIFEHLLAIMSEFGLKVFQQPTGDDLLELSKVK